MKKFCKAAVVSVLTIAFFAFAGYLTGGVTTEVYAASGPDGYGSITVMTYKKGTIDWSTEKYIYVGSELAADNTVSEVAGITYDESTNTLTLDGYNSPKSGITISSMGSDFKLVVNGKNNIQTLSSFNTITFDGTGKLVVNKNKACSSGISVTSDEDAVKAIFAKGSKVISYAGSDGYSLCVVTSIAKVNKAIVKKGGSMTKCKYDGKSESEAKRYICTAKKFAKR